MVTYPSDWKEYKINDVADIFDNLRIPVTKNQRKAGNIPYYGANGIQDYVSGYTHDGEFVLIAEDGANDLQNYPVTYTSGKIWVNNHAHVLAGVNSKADTRFLAYLLKTVDFSAVLVGGTRAKLNGKTLKNIEVTLPERLNEQQTIASVLSDFDEHIDNLSELIEKKKAIRDGALEDLVTGRTRLDGFSGEWESQTINDFIKIKRGASPRPIESYLTINTDGVNWIKIGDAPRYGKYIESTKERIAPSGANRSVMVFPDDFLLSNSMSFGRPYILKVKGCIHDGWLRLYDFQEKADKDFLFYLLSTQNVQSQYIEAASGSGVQNLNKDVVGEVKVVLPSLTEQQAIAQVLSAMDEEIESLEVEKEKMLQIKEGAMDDLLTGRVRLKV
ncbi:restriction endonuclease subunit S [Enterococcus faecium]|uniref:restriction endonuclease subunit S n=1 Tax=Enterococcus faecium TaxID=1352 RepID=UPI000BA03340|nr:restriction endonuclease subunit S [Enterococcus faecium]OZS37574.1 hypothetical protein CG820_04930 [Enterococcus faecium]